jgi:hypothetical protein
MMFNDEYFYLLNYFSVFTLVSFINIIIIISLLTQRLTLSLYFFFSLQIILDVYYSLYPNYSTISSITSLLQTLNTSIHSSLSYHSILHILPYFHILSKTSTISMLANYDISKLLHK